MQLEGRLESCTFQPCKGTFRLETLLLLAIRLDVSLAKRLSLVVSIKFRSPFLIVI